MKKIIDKSKNNTVCTLYIRQMIDIEQGSQEACVTNKPDILHIVLDSYHNNKQQSY